MKLLNAPRQPFVGLALMAATGIITAELFPLPSVALTVTAIILAVCIFAVAWRPRLFATYAIVGAGFFLLHNLENSNMEGQQLADELGSRPRVVTATGSVITEPKISSSGFATFLLKLKSVEFEGREQSTHAVWQVRWKGAPEFGDELKFSGTAEPIPPPRNPGEFDMRSYLARRDVRRMLFVRYMEDGTLIRHGGGNPIMRAAQKSRAWMQQALAEGWRTRPRCKIFSAGSCLASGTRRRRTSKNHFNRPAHFTFSLSLVCTWESSPRFYGCWRRWRGFHARPRRRSSFRFFFFTLQ